MISFSLNVVALILGASAVTLQSSDGGSYTGELKRLNAVDVVVQTSTDTQQVPVEQLLRITNSDVDAPKVEPSVTVGLSDGTIFGGVEFELEKEALSLIHI